MARTQNILKLKEIVTIFVDDRRTGSNLREKRSNKRAISPINLFKSNAILLRHAQ